MPKVPFGDRDLLYATLPGGGAIGCGFISKPDPARVPVDFIGEDHYSVVLLLAGDGTYEEERAGRVRLAPGSLIHRAPLHAHRTVPGADGAWREFFFLFPSACYRSLCSLGVLPGSGPVWHLGWDERLVAEWCSLLPAMRAASASDLPGLCLSALAWVGRAHRGQVRTGGDEARLIAARLCLSRDLERGLDLRRVARELRMSYTDFRRWFSRTAGCPPGAYRLMLRMERARVLLATTEMEIEAVAKSTGFCDRYAFSRAFSASAGCPPAAFRRRHG